MKVNFFSLFCLFFVALAFDLFAKDPELVHRQITWQAPVSLDEENFPGVKVLSFEGASYTREHVPYYSQNIPLGGSVNSVKVELEHAVFEPFKETYLLSSKNSAGAEVIVTSKVSYRKKQPYASVSLIPFRKNPATGITERLVSFDLKITPTAYSSAQHEARYYSPSSVLSSGTWYKIAVGQ